MRILHIFANPQLTHGASMFEYRIAEKLYDDGIIFDYLVTEQPTEDTLERYQKLGSKVHVLPISGRGGLIARELRANRAYLRFFREHEYDMVYADTENALRAFHLLMARFAGVKMRVLHSHNTGLQTQSRLSHMIARAIRPFFRLSVTDYFACSDLAAQWLFPRGIYKKHKYTVIKNGIDLKRFHFSAASRERIRSEWKLEGRFVLGSVGRFMPQKNQLFLIDLLCAVQKELPNACLMLVGDGPLRGELCEYALQRGVSESFILTGNVLNVEDYLCGMDVFILPSIFEGLGIVNIEAQATGLGCLVSDVVPKDACICKNTCALPLSAGADVWASRVMELRKYAVGLDRSKIGAELAEAGYELSQTAAILRSFYQSQLGDR